MPRPPKPPGELLKICKRWSDSIENISGDAARIEFFKNELPGFLRNRLIFEKLLTHIKDGNPYPDLRQAQMIDDEILLYLNPKRLFSLRMFLYGPANYTPIHDHNSWGVSGSALGQLGVVAHTLGVHFHVLLELAALFPSTMSPGEANCRRKQERFLTTWLDAREALGNDQISLLRKVGRGLRTEPQAAQRPPDDTMMRAE